MLGPPGASAPASRARVAALRSRNLLRISGRGSSWRAQLTDEGRQALEELGRDRAPLPEPNNAPTASGGTTPTASLFKTNQLTTDVIAAGANLTRSKGVITTLPLSRDRGHASQGRMPAAWRIKRVASASTLP
jgi:hypothetical protein